jgi:3'-phosphoadenosine 5'-phosphosulfate sulfotransferase
MKKIGIMLIFLIFFSCFNDSKKQIKNNLNSDRANVTFTIKWPEKNIKSNSKITANILPETQKIDIFLIKTLEMENLVV